MAENYRFGFGGYDDDYNDADEDNESDYDHGSDDGDQSDYRHEDAADVLTDEPVDDRRLLTGAVDEPVHDLLYDLTVDESAAYERIGRMKGSWRGRARARRQGPWILPDLRGFGPPVYWPVEDPDEAGKLARRPMGPSELEAAIRQQVRMQPLVSCSEVARNVELEEVVVTKTLQALQQQGKLKSVKVGCLMRPTARYWEARESHDGGHLDLSERAALSWHRDDAIGSLLRYDLPKVESINQAAVRYATAGWELRGLAWVAGEAVQAVGLYQWRQWDFVKGLIYFVWIPRWDTEQAIWERLAALPEAVGRITGPGLTGHVVLIGPDRWAVTRALPMAVECLKAWKVRPSNVAAWTYADGWQAASGASMLGGGAKPFRPALSAAAVDRFRWPLSLRRLGRTKLESVIKKCPWTRPDACTLYLYLGLVAEHPGGSIAHYAALAGKGEKDRLTWKRIRELVNLGLVREAGIAGMVNMSAADRASLLSERGQGQMRYRLSLSPKGEKELAEKQVGEQRVAHARPTANGAHRVMLDHGGLSYSEIVRRPGVGKVADRLGHRRVHDDILVDILGRHRLIGIETVPASRAITANAAGERVEPDGMLHCTSPVGSGPHYLELELSQLGPAAVRVRIKRYSLLRTSYPLAVICGTDLGARHFDRIGQELGVPVVATSIPRLRKIGLSGPAWLHQGQEVFVSPVACPPAPEGF